MGIDGIESRRRLGKQTYIIIIGGTDDGILRRGVGHAAQQTGIECRFLFLDAIETLLSTLAVVVELTVARHSLTEAHLLDVGNKQFHLIICNRRDDTQEGVGTGIIHAHYVNKGYVIICLGTTIVIDVERKHLMRIVEGGIEIAVMIGVGNIVQPVRLASILVRTS